MNVKPNSKFRKNKIALLTAAFMLCSICNSFLHANYSNENLSVNQTNRTIKGKVTDKVGDPLIGVSVTVTGTTVGAMTDIDGAYTINMPQGATQLRFSFIGFKEQIVSIQNKTNIDIVLEEDNQLLDEVVVVGYGTQKKASLTSAISQIKGDDALKNKGITNTAVGLQGEVPGLVVTRSSTRPGSEGATMKIRGDISINGNNSPYILIDGMSGSLDELNSMNPADIENISVLKDASAAIYGARSANGVILVTTKRGKAGKVKVSYSGSFSTTINGIRQPLTTNEQWLDMFYDAQYQDARAKNPTITNHDELMTKFDWWIFGSVLSGTSADGTMYNNQKLWQALRNGETLVLNNSGKTYRYEPRHYLMDELYAQSFTHKHSFNISGGDDKFTYIASLGYSDAQSQLKVADDGEKKYSGRLNMDYKANDFFKVETGMSYEKRNITNPSTDVSAGWYDPWFWPMYTEKENFYDTFGNRNPIGGLVGGGQIKNDLTIFRADSKVTLDLSKLFLDGITISGTGAYKSTQRNTQTSKNKIQYYDWADVATSNRQAPGSLEEKNQKWENITLGGFINYNKTFDELHNVAAMVGMTAEQESTKTVTASRNSGSLYPDSGLTDLETMISGTNNGAGGGQSSWGFVSYVTRLNYNYAGKYLVEFLGRRDGSSRLFPDYRWKNFYSVSGGWVISEENFLKDTKWLDFLKIRYNYGKTGSVTGIGDYEPYATVSTGVSYFGEGSSLATQPTMWLGSMTSPLRTWETLHSHNIGLDITVLNNRLTGSFDYFNKTNDGMFINVSYPSVLGASAPKTNSGEYNTKGWEITLNWKDKIGNIKYYIGGSLADTKSKLVDIGVYTNVPNAGNNVNRLPGMSGNVIYVYKTDGIFQTQEEVNTYYEKYYWNSNHSGPKANNVIPAPQESGTNRLRPGARKVVDTNGDGSITTEDLVYAGDASPHYTFGVKLGLEWKGLDFQAFFQGVAKQKTLRTGSIYAPWVTNYVLQNSSYMGKMWTEDNPNAEYTIASRDQNFNKWNYENRDISVQDSRYIRLKSLVIGYTLPQRITKLNKVRVYFSGDDLWEWTKIKDGYDPEYGEASNNTFPFSRLLSFGIDITF